MLAEQFPPGKYFISHSYWDRVIQDDYSRGEKSTDVFSPDGTKVALEAVIDHTKDPISALQKQLPPSAVLFMFPPINVSPIEFVSSSLIGAILACDGLIYLNESYSSQSFWVAFERDYALRSGKRVYAYTPSTKSLVQHLDPPLDLAIFASYPRKQWDEVRPILEFMKEQRHFDPWIASERVQPTDDWRGVMEEGMASTFLRGGYVVSFLGTTYSEGMIAETQRGLDAQRVIVASLGAQPPAFVKKFPHLIIQIVENGNINHNQIDNLIVRLYWLMFRIQFPNYS